MGGLYNLYYNCNSTVKFSNSRQRLNFEEGGRSAILVRLVTFADQTFADGLNFSISLILYFCSQFWLCNQVLSNPLEQT